MTGAEHYVEAERLLAQADGYVKAAANNPPRNPMPEIDVEINAGYLARATAYREEAQVHATLALAAATLLVAQNTADPNMTATSIEVEFTQAISRTTNTEENDNGKQE